MQNAAAAPAFGQAAPAQAFAQAAAPAAAFGQQPAAAPQSFVRPAQAAGNAGTYRLERGTWDIIKGAGGAMIAAFMLNSFLSQSPMSGPAMFWAAVAALAVLAFTAMIFDAFAGKAKFVADHTGLKTESFLGDYHIRWEDLKGFDTFTINWIYKMTQAKRTWAGRKTSSSRLNVPRKAFKSPEFAQMLAAYRPDLFS